MLADSARRSGLVIAASFAITACGSSTRKTIDTRDSGTTSPDLGSKGDLPADSNPVYEDAAADAGVVTTDAGPETLVLGRDSASPDTTIIKNDAGLDGNIVQKDTAVDGVALDVAVDGGGDGSILNVDGGDVDSGLTAWLAISPTDGAFWETGNTPPQPIVFTVSNVGSGASGTFTVTITGTDASYFEITRNSCDKPLPAGENCQVAVSFDAPAGAECRASLNIAADGLPGGGFAAPLTGASD